MQKDIAEAFPVSPSPDEADRDMTLDEAEEGAKAFVADHWRLLDALADS